MLFEEEINIREYALRIVPPEPIYSEIVAHKLQFKNSFGYGDFLNSKPHLSIISFYLDEQYQEKVLASCKNKLKTQPFEIALNGFVIFKEKKDSLVVNVSANSTWTSMLKEFVEILRLETRQKKSSLSPTPTPHITISKTQSDFHTKQVYDFFSKIEYSRNFTATKIEIVSRPYLKDNQTILPWDRFQSFSLSK